jgi:hypothetical protein
MIRKLAALKVGQPVRDDGPQTHLVKAGTPTMGGALILASITLTTLLCPTFVPSIEGEGADRDQQHPGRYNLRSQGGQQPPHGETGCDQQERPPQEGTTADGGGLAGHG